MFQIQVTKKNTTREKLNCQFFCVLVVVINCSNTHVVIVMASLSTQNIEGVSCPGRPESGPSLSNGIENVKNPTLSLHTLYPGKNANQRPNP